MFMVNGYHMLPLFAINHGYVPSGCHEIVFVNHQQTCSEVPGLRQALFRQRFRWQALQHTQFNTWQKAQLYLPAPVTEHQNLWMLGVAQRERKRCAQWRTKIWLLGHSALHVSEQCDASWTSALGWSTCRNAWRGAVGAVPGWSSRAGGASQHQCLVKSHHSIDNPTRKE